MQVSIIILSNHSVESFIPLLFYSNQLFLMILNEFIKVIIIDQSALLQFSIIILSNHSVGCYIPLLFSSNQLFLLILNVFIMALTID